MVVGEQGLTAMVRALLEHAGSEPDEAAVVAAHLVRANLTGHDSHGVGMLPWYVRFLKQGLLRPNTPVRLVRDGGALLSFVGDRGYGQRVAREAFDVAIARCAETGVVALTLGGAHHIGRIGSYGEQALDAGLVALCFVNVQDHFPLVAPFRGGDARFGTNPICIAIPGTEHTPAIVLDMATSRIALGKARIAMNRGETVPEGHVLDAAGRPTTDPRVMFAEKERGALLPLGEHKGYGLALACELLAGALSGGGTIQPGTPRQGSIINNLFAVLVDPARLVDASFLAAEIDAMVAYAKASPPSNPGEPVLVAGEPERTTAAARTARGIPIDETSWNEILDAGEAVGLARRKAIELAGAEGRPT